MGIHSRGWQPSLLVPIPHQPSPDPNPLASQLNPADHNPNPKRRRGRQPRLPSGPQIPRPTRRQRRVQAQKVLRPGHAHRRAPHDKTDPRLGQNGGHRRQVRRSSPPGRAAPCKGNPEVRVPDQVPGLCRAELCGVSKLRVLYASGGARGAGFAVGEVGGGYFCGFGVHDVKAQGEEVFYFYDGECGD
ncbi:hypothetical protein VTI74DRAFT_8415 [Chaetomium olivicolor]